MDVDLQPALGHSKLDDSTTLRCPGSTLAGRPRPGLAVAYDHGGLGRRRPKYDYLPLRLARYLGGTLEASSIDGAGYWRQFWRITLPLLTPIIFFNLITGMIDTFKLFTQAYVMTEGGPRNQSLFFTCYLFQKGFAQYQMGYASAMAVIVFFIIMALTLLVFRWSKAWGFYKGELTGSI